MMSWRRVRMRSERKMEGEEGEEEVGRKMGKSTSGMMLLSALVLNNLVVSEFSGVARVMFNKSKTFGISLLVS
jgi:hypothetical protein